MPLCCAETVLLTLKERKAKHKHGSMLGCIYSCFHPKPRITKKKHPHINLVTKGFSETVAASY